MVERRVSESHRSICSSPVVTHTRAYYCMSSSSQCVCVACRTASAIECKGGEEADSYSRIAMYRHCRRVEATVAYEYRREARGRNQSIPPSHHCRSYELLVSRHCCCVRLPSVLPFYLVLSRGTVVESNGIVPSSSLPRILSSRLHSCVQHRRTSDTSV